jgi:hypothetical protein
VYHQQNGKYTNMHSVESFFPNSTSNTLKYVYS